MWRSVRQNLRYLLLSFCVILRCKATKNLTSLSLDGRGCEDLGEGAGHPPLVFNHPLCSSQGRVREGDF